MKFTSSILQIVVLCTIVQGVKAATPSFEPTPETSLDSSPEPPTKAPKERKPTVSKVLKATKAPDTLTPTLTPKNNKKSAKKGKRKPAPTPASNDDDSKENEKPNLIE